MAETKDGGAAKYPITFNLLHDDPIVRAASLLNMSVQSFIAGAAQGEAERLLAAHERREADRKREAAKVAPTPGTAGEGGQ